MSHCLHEPKPVAGTCQLEFMGTFRGKAEVSERSIDIMTYMVTAHDVNRDMFENTFG